jgi:hypothetical protein
MNESTSKANESCVDRTLTGNFSSTPMDNIVSDDKFEWDLFTRGIVLSSFSYGYLTAQEPDKQSSCTIL